jgi:hypothetical protein
MQARMANRASLRTPRRITGKMGCLEGFEPPTLKFEGISSLVRGSPHPFIFKLLGIAPVRLSPGQGYRRLKLASGTTSEYGRYVKSLRGAP